MANSSESLALQYHGRSISLPSRLQHPSAIQIEYRLNKLKAFETSSLPITPPLTLDAIQCGLNSLVELYNWVQELMGSPTTQTTLAHYQRGVVVEEALERSVEALDSCASARDLGLMIMEHVQVLQSALRRKNGDLSIESDIKGYLCLRKKVKKEATKNLRILKQMESRLISSPPGLDMEYQLIMLSRILREVTGITIGILRLLLVFLAPQDSSGKRGGWSLIAKLMLKKTVASKNGCFLGDLEGVDSSLATVLENLRSPDTKDHVLIARRRLEILGSSIEGVENGLECLFRQLVSHRVSLLNILNH